MDELVLDVPNISCNHCVHTIKMELSEIPGVSTVTADALTKKVIVSFDAPASENEIRQVLTAINYPAL